MDELTAVTGVGGSLDRRCGGRDSSPAAGERDEVCVTARVSRRWREVAGVPASGAMASGAFGDSIVSCWAGPCPTGIRIGPRTQNSRK